MLPLTVLLARQFHPIHRGRAIAPGDPFHLLARAYLRYVSGSGTAIESDGVAVSAYVKAG